MINKLYSYVYAFTYYNVMSALKGGAGSGHFGHAGRPGKVGGSAPRGGFSVSSISDRF